MRGRWPFPLGLLAMVQVGGGAQEGQGVCGRHPCRVIGRQSAHQAVRQGQEDGHQLLWAGGCKRNDWGCGRGGLLGSGAPSCLPLGSTPGLQSSLGRLWAKP